MQDTKGAGEILELWLELPFTFLKTHVTCPKFTRKAWWVNSSKQLSTHTSAGSRHNRKKVSEPMDEIKDSLTGEAKAVHASKTKEFVCYLPWVDRCPATPWKVEPEHT